MTADRKYWTLLLLVLFPLYLTWTFDHSLWNPDETRDAGIAWEMQTHKDFVVPRLNGEAFLEKPPLYYWTCSLVYNVAGRVNAGLTRLPAALYGFLGVLFTFLIGRRLGNARVGIMAGAMLATSAQYFRMSHFALMDSALAALITGAVYFYVAGQTIPFVLMAILVFYTKGFVGVAVAGVIILADAALERSWKRLITITAVGVLLFIPLVAPWVWGLWKSGGLDYLRIFFIDNNWNRFASGSVDHAAPFYFYLGSFPVDFLPWTLFTLAAIFLRTPAPRFARTWFFSIFVFLSLASGKRSMYLLPAFPAAAILAAFWFENLINRQSATKVEKGVIGVTIGILLLAMAAVSGGHIYLHRGFIGGVIGFAILAGVFVYFKRAMTEKNYERVFQVMAAAMCLNLVLADAFFVKDMDEDKSFLPYIASVKAAQGDMEVTGFDMSEMERGVFSFYFDRRIRNFLTVGELMVFSKQQEKPFLMMANRNKNKDLVPAADDVLEKIGQFRANEKTRSYNLFRSKPSSKK